MLCAGVTKWHILKCCVLYMTHNKAFLSKITILAARIFVKNIFSVYSHASRSERLYLDSGAET